MPVKCSSSLALREPATVGCSRGLAHCAPLGVSSAQTRCYFEFRMQISILRFPTYLLLVAFGNKVRLPWVSSALADCTYKLHE
jgi:hypothetical protein